MTRLRGFTDLLIPDDCGRRALEETIADWREERARAESPFAHIAVDLRASLSLARVLAMVGGAGLRQAEVWRFLLFTCLAATAAAAVQLSSYINSRPGLTAGEVLSLFPVAILGIFGMMASAFGFGLKPNRPFPGTTLVVAAVLLVGLGLGFVVPAAKQYFRESVAERLAAPGQRRPATRGIPETTSAGLLRRAMTDDAAAASARRAMFERLTLTVAAPALLLLGAGLRARLHSRLGWRMSQIGGGIAAILIFVSAGASGLGLAELASAAWPSLAKGDLRLLPWWSAIVVSLMVLLRFLAARDSMPRI